MSKPVFVGAGVAIVTPFFENGDVNFKELERMIEFEIENGIDSIIICGSTGEAATMTDEEHEAAIKCAIDTVAGRVPVIAGTGSNSTETAIYLSTEAEKYGADALLLVSPYYNKATQGGLYQHFKQTADAVKIPCILYNVPGRTGCNILPATVVKLCTDVKNSVGIKEASGNISQIAKLAALADGKVEIYSGNDDQIVPIMSLGGLGVISVLSNVAPKQTHDICQAFFDGDTAKAAKLQCQAIELIDALFCEVNPIPVKKAVSLLGYNAGPLRLPLTDMEPEHVEVLKKAMKNYGIL